MPRYHFNLQGRSNCVDREGQILPDLSAARHEAERYADGLPKVADGPLALAVTDDEGTLLFQISLKLGRSSG